MTSEVESLNASVAAAVALAEVARRRSAEAVGRSPPRGCELRRETRQLRREASAIYAGAGAAAGPA